MVGEMRRRKRNTLYSPKARIDAVLGRCVTGFVGVVLSVLDELKYDSI